MYSLGWGRVVKHGSGSDGYLLGRKNKLGNVVRFYLILFCSLTSISCGFGIYMLRATTMLLVLIIIYYRWSTVW